MTQNNPLTRDFERKLSRLHGFADLVEETLTARTEALDADVTRRAEHVPEHERQDFFEYYAEDYVELSDELPTVLRYAVLTAADTALEVYLNTTCETYAEVNKVRIHVADLKRAGIVRAREYLEKVAAVKLPQNWPIWTTVLRLHDLRNSIVHTDGYVGPSRTDLHKWASSIPGLRIRPDGTIYLAKEFSENAISQYENFAREFDQVCGELGLWQSVFPFDEV